MGLKIAEWFGHDLGNRGEEAERDRRTQRCPFLDGPCVKRFNDGTPSGVCSAYATSKAGTPLAICPNRLYADRYLLLRDVARMAFGETAEVIHPSQFRKVVHNGMYVVALGKRYGTELRLPKRRGRGNFFVDWILCRVGRNGAAEEFVALEVQTIDTIGSYRAQVQQLRRGNFDIDRSKAGLNWENVNKRILPQLIYKGQVLRQEQRCSKGLFFVCPTEVYENIRRRLAGGLTAYHFQPGTLTFLWYGFSAVDGGRRRLNASGSFTTTIDQVVWALNAPTDLPEPGVYELAIEKLLESL